MLPPPLRASPARCVPARPCVLYCASASGEAACRELYLLATLTCPAEMHASLVATPGAEASTGTWSNARTLSSSSSSSSSSSKSCGRGAGEEVWVDGCVVVGGGWERSGDHGRRQASGGDWGNSSQQIKGGMMACRVGESTSGFLTKPLEPEPGATFRPCGAPPPRQPQP